jgi:hypothetical protein
VPGTAAEHKRSVVEDVFEVALGLGKCDSIRRKRGRNGIVGSRGALPAAAVEADSIAEDEAADEATKVLLRFCR